MLGRSTWTFLTKVYNLAKKSSKLISVLNLVFSSIRAKYFYPYLATLFCACDEAHLILRCFGSPIEKWKLKGKDFFPCTWKQKYKNYKFSLKSMFTCVSLLFWYMAVKHFIPASSLTYNQINLSIVRITTSIKRFKFKASKV